MRFLRVLRGERAHCKNNGRGVASSIKREFYTANPGEKDRAITRSDAVGVVNRGFPRSHAIQRQTPRQTAA